MRRGASYDHDPRAWRRSAQVYPVRTQGRNSARRVRAVSNPVDWRVTLAGYVGTAERVGATIEELDTSMDIAIAGNGQDWYPQTFSPQFLDHFAARAHPVTQIGIEDDQVISDGSDDCAEF